MKMKQFLGGPKWVYEPHENEPCAVCNRRAVEKGGTMPLCDEHAAERRQYIQIQQHGCYWNANVAGSPEITADTPGVRERAAVLGVPLRRHDLRPSGLTARGSTCQPNSARQRPVTRP